jgi:hypothetical protein
MRSVLGGEGARVGNGEREGAREVGSNDHEGVMARGNVGGEGNERLETEDGGT